MNRREAMKNLALMFGANLITPIKRALADNFDPIELSGANIFNNTQKDQITTITEIIIPATDTPGAREANVVVFIEGMLQEWYNTKEKNKFIDALSDFTNFCNKNYKKHFTKLDKRDQIACIQALNSSKINTLDDGGESFFNQIKQLTIFGYYTSEIGMTVERKYLPNPGSYDGAYLYNKVNTLFTS